MPIVPAFLQKQVNPVLQKIRRTSLYTERYNNTLGFRLNENYFRWARKCAAVYATKHGKQIFDPSPLRTTSVERVRNILPKAEAQKYSDHISQLIESNDIKARETHGTIDLLRDVEHPLRTLGTDYLKIFHEPALHRALLNFFHGDYRIEWVAAFRTLPSDRIASTWKWHSDSFPPFTCKLFLHLTPATGDTGATEFFNGEDTITYRRAGYFGQYKEERTGDLESFAKEKHLPYKPFHVDVEAGDGSLFNMNHFHRAVAPRHGFRDVIEFFLVPNAVPWDEQFEYDGIDALKCNHNRYFLKNPSVRCKVA